MTASITNLTWSAVAGLVVLLGFLCFIAVLWSRREWQSRKIRVGMFLEREYRDPEVVETGTPEPSPPADDAPTKEIRRDDAW